MLICWLLPLLPPLPVVLLLLHRACEPSSILCLSAARASETAEGPELCMLAPLLLCMLLLVQSAAGLSCASSCASASCWLLGGCCCDGR